MLEKSLAASNNLSVPSDLFGLVVCHAKLGEGGRARAYFERALAWVKANPELSGRMKIELDDFRAEAEGVLRDSYRDLPDDVFAEDIPEAIRNSGP